MSGTRKIGLWRQIALLLLFLGLTVVVVLEFAGAHKFGSAIASAAWHWLVLSALLFFASFYLYALLYRVGFQAVKVESKTSELLAPLMVSILGP